ncbi:O-antigen ligase family protein [Nonomuraea soli]|uniref:O-antigen ligase domain-containing protein n=1 Tax=Nonomuraea soli TaxID=1032476 RepID=A0A7W0CV69_9ACTN|nr:hypothetical protein [Nonomuraea soli]MBA2897979.1 hypothetical protein [Nonomuraea soli]
MPVWPLYLLFAGYPLWWSLGLGSFAAVLLAVPMMLVLVIRGGIRVPRGFGLWMVFLLLAVAAASRIDTPERLVGLVFRLMTYAGATVVFVYVYNLPRERLPLRRLVALVVVFWLWVVAGGFLGYLFPEGSLSTPMEHLLPGSLTGNSYVRDLVHPRFAEIQWPYGAPEPFQRPSAPFPYTNAWGSHFALLMPFVLLLMTTGSRRVRIVLGVVAAASLVPAFATLNRGMLLALGAGLVYVAVRFAVRGRLGLLVATAGLLVAAGAGAYASGVGDSIDVRTDHSTTTAGRQAVYTESFLATVESPVLGYGGPRPSRTLPISMGTQGHFWNVMFSFGFPALGLFCAVLWGLAWRTRSPATDERLWLHAVPVMAGFMIFYYGFDGGLQLVIVFTAAAALLRERREPAA